MKTNDRSIYCMGNAFTSPNRQNVACYTWVFAPVRINQQNRSRGNPWISSRGESILVDLLGYNQRK